MEMIKKLGKIVGGAALSALTACVVQDMYKTYAHNDVAKTRLKNKIKGLNPFNKN